MTLFLQNKASYWWAKVQSSSKSATSISLSWHQECPSFPSFVWVFVGDLGRGSNHEWLHWRPLWTRDGHITTCLPTMTKIPQSICNHGTWSPGQQSSAEANADSNAGAAHNIVGILLIASEPAAHLGGYSESTIRILFRLHSIFGNG